MIVLISSIAVPDGDLVRYQADLQENTIPAYEAAPGLISVSLLKRQFAGYAELMIISQWQSEELIRHFTENLSMPKRPGNPSGVIQLEQRSYELLLFCEGKARGADLGGKVWP